MDTAQQFIALAVNKNVLKFGEFQLKSGRISPYFFNAGLFDDGHSLALLGEYYAKTIKNSGLEFDMLYGPAYKGIPLATAIAVAWHHLYAENLPVAFNRKEAKKHGEGGQLIGAPVKGKVLIVDDVVSAGTSVRESIELISQEGATTVGIAVALDRQEKGAGDRSAMQELSEEFELSTISIADLDALFEYLSDDAENLAKISAYRAQYGV
ncbi:orotate phosphoribosyltransferase [Marinicella sp. S1101]|uniref:orotate phosphoribosyltransferase n=1 Tax=Marinicella marina TaxID=2996016 RepID=UPI002260E918|nr:orotate phosphoribosyltransferase [Marinicella marina]MCX7554161.1 orotate phosphoribosyltransferase [Marinicella marina]MDJ1141146.1 orotate phosphoribosyltransferase [Marinicella marina]